MAPLQTPQRKKLESAIKKARVVAERGARKALQALAVDLARPHESMSEADCELRKSLRAHGRQLGDARDPDKSTQSIVRLEREVAYEHWHRMLFARFLAENRLLIKPGTEVDLSLEEVEVLAREANTDLWVLAARYAAVMLPAIFRPDDPALAVKLAREDRQELERLLADLPVDVFTADDSLGWTYQFWQASEKEAVNERVKSGEKITGATLPAVTQLFTEHYMVLFLLHNTLGSWHAGKVLAAHPELASDAQSESELRRAVALPGLEWEYLRFVRETREGDAEGSPSGPWRPAAGTFSTWPVNAALLEVLDPCCGSGHFLVAAFEILVRMRIAEEGLALEDAIRAVLRDNLAGLELDARCTQIAAFNLAFAAWKWTGKPIALPQLQIACSGLGPEASKAEWLQLAESAAAAGGMPAKRDLFGKQESLLSEAMRSGFEALHELFERAPDLGSLIDPSSLPKDMYHADFAALEPVLARMLEARDDEQRERAVAAAGMARAARILVGPSGGYTLVVTNVPYLGRKSHTPEFKEWVDKHHKEAKNDLATVFVSRMLQWVGHSGTVAAVTPQNWLFLTGYKKLRVKLLTQRSWNLVARLGPKGFRTPMWDFNILLVCLSGSSPTESQWMGGLDVSAVGTPDGKAALLRGEHLSLSEEHASTNSADVSLASIEPTTEEPDTDSEPDSDTPSGPADGSVRLIAQAAQLKNPDSRIMFAARNESTLLASVADSFQGIGTSDNAQFVFRFWEFPLVSVAYRFVQIAPREEQFVSGSCCVLHWEGGEGRYYKHALGLKAEGRLGGWKSGGGAWGRLGVAVSVTGVPRAAAYLGTMFDTTMAAVVPRNPADMAAVLCFVRSAEFERLARNLDQALSLTEHSLLKTPFSLSRWQRIAVEQYPQGLPAAQSNDPTQWPVHGHPAGLLAGGAASRSPFGVADPGGTDRHPSLICREPNVRDVLQVAVARLLGYRWPAEHDEQMLLDVAARAWVAKCRALDTFVDKNGIVCLTPMRGEPSAADRVRALLAAALADVPSGFAAARERELLRGAAADRSPADSLEEWLRDHFFDEHCSLFHQLPFVWHVWDGRKDGFSALVNYHRLAAPAGEGRRTLESLAHTYLGEWIERQRAEQREKREGSDGRLAAALTLKAELEKILAGEPPYDLFVRWKPLHEQAIGWEPDIDDGVRLNIRPFLAAANVDRKGAGILRAKPNIKWAKDRGKEPQSLRPRLQFPWFWGCDPDKRIEHRINFGFPALGAPAAGSGCDGQRWNDLHYTRAAKEAARADAHKAALT